MNFYRFWKEAQKRAPALKRKENSVTLDVPVLKQTLRAAWQAGVDFEKRNNRTRRPFLDLFRRRGQ